MNTNTTSPFLRKASTYLIAALIACFSGMFLTAQDAKAEGTCNDPDDPLQISSFNDLDTVLRDNADQGCFFIQTQNIDAAGQTLGGIAVFNGDYDGQGFAIENLVLAGSGMFTLMTEAIFEDVAFINVDNQAADENNSGILAGSATNGTEIRRVFIEGQFTRNADSGRNHGGFVGVLAGQVDSDGFPLPGGDISFIEDSYSSVRMNARANVGGIAGLVNNGRITNSYAIGPVVTRSIATNDERGPVVGGVGSGGGTFENVYYNSETVGIANFTARSGISALDSREMKNSGNFNTWSFNGAPWTIHENVSFPYLGHSLEPVIAGPNFEVDSNNSGGGEDFDPANAPSAWRHLGNVLQDISYGDYLSSLFQPFDYQVFQTTPPFSLLRTADENQHFRLWTQGFTNAENTTGQPNVQIWNVNENTDPLTSNFVGISNLNNTIGFGEAFTMFVFNEQIGFENDNVTEQVEDTGFPKYPLFRGVPFDQEVDIVGDANTTIDDWSFIANSYLLPVNADSIITTGITDVVYMWNPEENTHEQATRTGTGSTSGDFTHVAPFQGILFQTEAEVASLVIPSDARSTISGDNQGNHRPAGNIVKSLNLQAAVPESPLRSYAYVSFADFGVDEGIKLLPQGGYAFVELALEGTGTRMMHSRHFQGEQDTVVEIPVSANYFEAVEDSWVNKSRTVSLSWSNIENFESDWEFYLIDTETGTTTNMLEVSSIEVDLQGSSNRTIERPKTMKATDVRVRDAEKNAVDSRFILQIVPGTLTSTPRDNDLPSKIALKQNYPNPFNPTTTIEYTLNETSDVTLEVFNMTGQRVAVLENGSRSAGTHTISFDASSLASGVYMYRLQAGNTVLTRKMTLIK